MGILKNFSIGNKGLRYKLLLAFSLMSVIPLLACTYIITTYLFPHLETLAVVSIVIVVSVCVSILGFFLARGLIDPVIDMALEARIIASGEYSKKITVSGEDEIGNLGRSINAMTQKIKTNIDELKNYGQKMREINVEIHKKVLALSSLLQIGDIISSGSIHLDSLLELAVDKAASVFDTGYSVLYMPKQDGADEFVVKASSGTDKEGFEKLVLKKGGSSPLDKAIDEKSVFILDKGTKLSKEAEALKTVYNLKNIVAMPIHSGKNDLGIFIIGNRVDDFKFKPDDIDLIKVFGKQISIAIESDILSRKAKDLSIVDDLTGLYNKNFILSRLEEEIKRAIFYQRPCSFIIFGVDNFKAFRDTHGELVCEEALKKIAKVIKDNGTPIAKVARISGDEFAILLPERNKREAGNIGEEIKKRIESINILREAKATLTVSGGVSENPIDGATADELFKKAMETLKQAKSSGKNVIMT